MPCLNEAETLAGCIRQAQSFLESHGVAGEVVVGDNGSTDGSQEIARACGARVVDVPIRGYGAALYFATLAARGRYIIMGDSDGSHDLAHLGDYLGKLRAGDELVIGNRFLGGIEPGAMSWKNRYLGNPVLSGLGRFFFRSPVRDFHCGLRGFTRAAFHRMDLRTTGMEYASEMVIKATLLQLRISEVPTRMLPAGRTRPPHLRPWRDGWRHLRFMLLYSPNWLFFYPGLALMVLGMAGTLWLWPGPQPLFGVYLDIHTLIYSALGVLIGFQAVGFAIFTKIFAISQGLLPESRTVKWFLTRFTLESGLLVGVAALLAGIGSFAYLLVYWSHHFGDLRPQDTLRFAVPSILFLMMGCQVILSSFFLSVLGMGVRRNFPEELAERLATNGTRTDSTRTNTDEHGRTRTEGNEPREGG